MNSTLKTMPALEGCSAKCHRAILVPALIGLAVFAALSLAATNVHAEEQLIVVKQTAWTNYVDKKNRQVEKTYQDTAPVAPLYLWMRVTGGEAALAQLKEEGKLPIRHKWFLERLIGTTPEGVTTMLDDINIPAGANRLLEQLQYEVNQRGFFDWRTWSMKEHIRRGLWRVRVVYADGEPVLCGEQNAPCEFAIKVK